GERWAEEIVRAIRACKVLLLLCSDASMRSRAVKQEVQLAWEGQKALLPLRLGRTGFPDVFQFFLAGLQWLQGRRRPAGGWLAPGPPRPRRGGGPRGRGRGRRPRGRAGPPRLGPRRAEAAGPLHRPALAGLRRRRAGGAAAPGPARPRRPAGPPRPPLPPGQPHAPGAGVGAARPPAAAGRG